jgi:hypothetical protein
MSNTFSNPRLPTALSPSTARAEVAPGMPVSTPPDAVMRTPPPALAPPRRQRYRTCLAWAFTAFNTTRVLTYLPLVWAMHEAQDSSQHSLLTWVAWLGANTTTGLWLYESGGQRVDRVLLVSLANAAMNLLVIGVILWYRI